MFVLLWIKAVAKLVVVTAPRIRGILGDASTLGGRGLGVGWWRFMRFAELTYRGSRAGLFRFSLFFLLFFSLLVPARAAAQSDPSFDDLVQKAAAARERDDVPQAVELYSEAVRLKPDWPDGWWFLGSLQYEANSYSASQDALTHYVELVPDGGPAWALRGLCEFETGDYTQSLADIERGESLRAASQSRDEKVLRYYEAQLLTRSGRFERALQKYAPLAQGTVRNPELLVGIGLAGLRTPLLPKELRVDKTDLFKAAGHAAFLFMSGNPEGAQREFQELFQHFPAAENAHYFYGSLLFPTDPDAAIIEFNRELEINPSNAAAQLMVAWNFIMRNNAAEALPYATNAISADPAPPGARLALGRALVETGDVKGGIDLLGKESQIEPDSLEIHFALAEAYSKAGRKDDARRERMLCLQIEKNAPRQAASR